MPFTSQISANLDMVLDAIAAAAEKAGRNLTEVKLVAVSKTYPAGAVAEALSAGQLSFGENRVQELEDKVPALPERIEWHLIGHLQGNKVRKALMLASWIHSVDTQKLLLKIDRVAGELGVKPKILLEVNVSGEESKFGQAIGDDAMRLARLAAKCGNIDFQGLMTMAPFGADERGLRGVFARLRGLRDRIAVDTGLALPELSMGMSADFVEAIAEGATMVRIGSAIFGNRVQN